MSPNLASARPAVNRGRTRADAVLTLKVDHEVGGALQALAARGQAREA